MAFDGVAQGEIPLSRSPKVTRNAPSKKAWRPRIVSLFAGIGGFDKAFDLEGGRVVLQCEAARFARSVLRRHWPHVEMSDDIRDLKPEDIPDAEVWTAGFPCQDVSLARGKHGRTGFKGNHTSLFFRLMDLVRAKRPPVVLLENVVGLLNSHQGRDFAVVLQELTLAGYAVAWRVLNARYFGVPQSRSRVFLCAWLGDPLRALTALYEPVLGGQLPSERLGFTTQAKHPTGAIVPEVAYCVAATSGRHTGNDWSRSYISYHGRVRRPTPTESERLQGFPAGWSEPGAELTSPARGFDGERYRAVGNAVAVPVVRWVAARIVGPCHKALPALPCDDLPALTGRLAPGLDADLRSISLSESASLLEEDCFVRRWRTGGCAWGDAIVEANASPAPAAAVPSSFRDVLDAEVPEERYFLTANAAEGILRRADSVGRSLFAPMRLALNDLVGKDSNSGVAAGGVEIAGTSVRPIGAVERRHVEVAGRAGQRLL